MLNRISEKFFNIFKKIKGQGYISEKSINSTIRDVRKIFLEADVNLSVIKHLIGKIKNKIVGKEINKSLTPGQEFIKILNQELISILGNKNESINLSTSSPAVILIIGGQGSGKTTSAVKLGEFLYNTIKKKSIITSLDIYRPASNEQLEILTKNTHVSCVSSMKEKNLAPIEILKSSFIEAKKMFYDILIVDTAGCNYSNKELIEEIKQIKNYINPIETLFVIDAMIGQEAVNIIKYFNNVVKIDGIILTKTDGDVRGGAALSIRYITGIPIKFIGTGEKINEIQKFYPERFASSILGMGDILSLIENIESHIFKEKNKVLFKKRNINYKFDLNDFLKQLKQIKRIGGINSIISKLPFSNKYKLEKSQINDLLIKRMEAMINSMTIKERNNPELLKGSRKRRIAIGSGVTIQDINKMLKQFNEINKFIKGINKNRLASVSDNIKKFIFNR